MPRAVADAPNLSHNAALIWKVLCSGEVRFKQDTEFHEFAVKTGMTEADLGPASEELIVRKMAEFVAEDDDFVLRATEPAKAALAGAEADDYTERLTAAFKEACGEPNDALTSFQRALSEMSAGDATEAVRKIKQAVFPFWSDEIRINANAIVRSALFSATRTSAERQRFEVETPVAALEGTELFYTGFSLNQLDADVFEAALHLCRRSPVGDSVEISPYEFLRTIGVADTPTSRVAVEASLSRMVGGKIRVKRGKGRLEATLIRLFEKNEANNKYRIELQPEIARIFETDTRSMAPSRLLAAVRDSPLASWLARFFLSHLDPFPIKYKKLQLICGSAEKNPRKFRMRAKTAMQKIERAHDRLTAKDEDYRDAAGGQKWLHLEDDGKLAVATPKSTAKHRRAVELKAKKTTA